MLTVNKDKALMFSKTMPLVLSRAKERVLLRRLQP